MKLLETFRNKKVSDREVVDTETLLEGLYWLPLASYLLGWGIHAEDAKADKGVCLKPNRGEGAVATP